MFTVNFNMRFCCNFASKLKYSLRTINPTSTGAQFFSSPLSRISIKDRKQWVVLSNDGHTIVCWHPETAPEYEHTKPLPAVACEIHEEDSILNISSRIDEKYRFQTDGPTIPELMKLTYTSKHRWYRNRRKMERDPPPPVDREGL